MRDGDRDEVKDLVYYLLKEGNIRNAEQFRSVLQHKFSEEVEVTMLTYGQMLIKEGRQQGIQEGMQQGIQRGMQQGLRQGLQQGFEKGLEVKNNEIIQKLLSQTDLSDQARMSLIKLLTGLTEVQIQQQLSTV